MSEPVVQQERPDLTGLSPLQMAVEAQSFLRAMADPARAEQAARYFPSQPQILGAPSGLARELGADLARALGRTPDVATLATIAEVLYASAVLEDGACANELLGRRWRRFAPGDWERFEDWLPHFSCWATTDSFGLKVLGPLVMRDGPSTERLQRWIEAESHWQQRAALVSLIPSARRGRHLEVVWPLVDQLLSSPHDMIQKALGWTLKEASKADADAVIAYVSQRGARVTLSARRHALQRMSPEQRARARR